jgi:hypothetical protein
VIDPEVINKLWERTEPLVYITKGEFIAGLDGWDVKGFDLDGELAYATLTKGPDFHFMIFCRNKACTPGIVRSCLKPILDEHGYVTTKAPKTETRQHRFNKIIGFKETGEDEFYIYFRMNQEDARRWSR